MPFNVRTISSPAVLVAERRRTGRAVADNIREEWFIGEVLQRINLTMRTRVRIATEFLRTKVVYNISRPVTKTQISGGSTGRQTILITNRSRPGEFPKADTTLLMRSIFGTVRNPEEGVYDGYVGTPVHYAVPLELTMNRSFLRRTLLAEQPRIVGILTGPILKSDVL